MSAELQFIKPSQLPDLIDIAGAKGLAIKGGKTYQVPQESLIGPQGSQGPQGVKGEQGPAGEDGVDHFVYTAYASDNAGTGFSLIPTDLLKYRAEIHSTVEIPNPTASDFAAATWVKYIGEDGEGAGDMLKSVYDTNNNGKADAAEQADNATNAEKLAGVAANLYALKSYVNSLLNYISSAIPTSGSTLFEQAGSMNWLVKQVKIVTLADNLTETSVLATYDSPTVAGAVDGGAGQVMVKIPKFYYRETSNDSGELVQLEVADNSRPGFTCHPKFVRPDGSEREFIYIGAYEGSNSGGKLASVSGLPVWTSQTLATYRSSAFSRGSGWYPYDFWTHHLIQLLFYMYYATFDSQAALPGYTERTTWNDSYKRNTGRSNILTGINGTVPADLSGQDSDLDDTNWRIAEKYIANRFLFIENIFGHVWKFLDGCTFDGRTGQPNYAYVTNDPTLFSSADAEILANYQQLGYDLPAASNEAYIESLQAGFLPKKHGGSSSTYVTDYFWSYLNDTARDYFRSGLAGGTLGSGGQAGVAAHLSNLSLGYAYSYLGSRLCAAP